MVLEEADVTRAFHSILKDALAQATAEGLLDEQALLHGDADVQIAGPSLVLFYAALGSEGHDGPAISAPDGSCRLSAETCPASFASFFDVWAPCVPQIKSLPDSARYDLALLLCDREPLSSPLRIDVARLAASLKSVALEITQRRTFQRLFASDLQHAINSGTRHGGESDRRSMYAPPPEYDDRPIEEKPAAGISNQVNLSPTLSSRPSAPPLPPRPVPPAAPVDLAPEMMENLAVIRETLYSALAETLLTTPTVRELLGRGPSWASRVYFASTCLAILEVALNRVDENGVRVVQMGASPRTIGGNETPPYLRTLLNTLMEISQACRQMRDEDDERAIIEATEGEVTTVPRLDRLRERLEKGVGVGDIGEEAERSTDQSVAMLANAINECALGMASLPAFADRQREVFPVLMSVTS